jgi:hypothetical protein
MKDMVKAAVIDRFEACLPTPSQRQGTRGYTKAPHDNLLPDLDTSILDDFSTGDGGELGGPLPKFCAAHSSAALAANSFGWFRFHPERLQLAGLGGFTEARFEKRLPTGLGGNPPNLDFFVAGPNGAVAIESKFTETLGSKKAEFASSYDKAVGDLAEPQWQQLFAVLKDDPKRFTCLDAAQLVKHYLGIRHSLSTQGGTLALVYVYWEPTNASEIPEFALHRDELSRFSDSVEGSAIRFFSLSYPTLWEQWTTPEMGKDAASHVDALRARYLMPVPPPAS